MSDWLTGSALERLRQNLEAAFADDTRAPGTVSSCPSAGHCAAAAIVVRRVLGGEFVSALVDGQSHWFNRVDGFDVDLTGDQFSRPKVQISIAGAMYPDSRIRSAAELMDETIRRADLLAKRAGV